LTLECFSGDVSNESLNELMEQEKKKAILLTSHLKKTKI